MELLSKIEEIILDELNLKEHSVTDVYKVGEKIQALAGEYGKRQYNQALDLAAEKCNYPYKDEYGCGCNVPSIILSLKK